MGGVDLRVADADPGSGICPTTRTCCQHVNSSPCSRGGVLQSSFVPQRHHWIDLRRAAPWHKCSGECARRKRDNRQADNHRVVGLDAIKLGRCRACLKSRIGGSLFSMIFHEFNRSVICP